MFRYGVTNFRRSDEIGEVGIMKHLCICNRPFPATLGMEKTHGKVTDGQGISCEGAIVITQGISIGGGKCVEMGAINGSKSVLEEGV